MKYLSWLYALPIVWSCALMAADRPNVLFIAVDDLNDFPTFCQRYPDAITPNMDRLADSGIVFSNAHCQFPVCGPSRASVMSGLLPSTLGFANHMKDEVLEERAAKNGTRLLHTYFADHGYKTLAVGKICHHHVPQGSVDESGGGFRDLDNEEILFGEKLKRNWHQEGTYTDWSREPEREDQLVDYHVAKWAVEKLGQQHKEPFMLMVGFQLPHVPWYVQGKWWDLYDRESITLPPFDENDLDDVPEIAKRISVLPQMPRTEWAIEHDQWRNIVQAYLACVSYVDHQVGKVLKALEGSPYADNTIIVLWSDHGYHMGEKNTFQKQSLWERSSHAPLVFAGPNIEPGKRSDRVVSLIDIYPTIVDLCGLPDNTTNQGNSLVPLIEEPARNWPYPAIVGWEEDSFAIVNEQYRYIRYGDGSEELYDIRTDPDEINNLARDADYSAVKLKLAKTLDRAINRHW